MLFLNLVTGIYLLLAWLKTDSTSQLVLGTGCLGFNLLIRVTTVFDAFYVSLFVLTLLAQLRARAARSAPRCGARHGSWLSRQSSAHSSSPSTAFIISFASRHGRARFTTFTRSKRDVKGTCPRAFPGAAHSGVGFLGPLRVPWKTVFLFDPLLIVLIVLSLGSWNKVRPVVRLWLVTMLALFVTYLGFYARLRVWGADPSWGCRYHLTPIWLMCLVTLPILAEVWDSLGYPKKVTAIVVIAGAIAVELAALFFHYMLEYVQGLSGYVVGWRFLNVAAFLTGRVHQWGLDQGDPSQIESCLVPNFTPFRLAYRHQQTLARVAGALLVVLMALLVVQLAGILKSPRIDSPAKLPSTTLKTARRALARLLLLGTSLGLSIVLCELIVRVVAPQPPSWLPVYRPYGPPPYYGLERNLRYVCDTGESRWLICTDDVGHRTAAQPSPAVSPDAARVLLIGDSFTFGQGVNYEDSFAGILDRSQPRWQFINAGVGAYGPVEYRQALEQELKNEQAPRLVIVTTFLGNDITDCVRRQISSPEWITSQPGGLRNWIKRSTHLYRLVSKCGHLLMPDAKTFTQFERNLYMASPWEEGTLQRGTGHLPR